MIKMLKIVKITYKVFVFLTIAGHPLHASYYGPYENESKITEVKYVVITPVRRKQKHVALLIC